MKKTRIVSTVPSTTDILVLLGLQDQLVGFDEQSIEHVMDSSSIQVVGPFDNINAEKVASLNPDLVITTTSVPGSEPVIDALKEKDLPLLTLHTERFDDLLGDIYNIGVECGVEERAAAVVETYSKRIKLLSTGRREIDDSKRVYFEWWPNPFVTVGSQSWVSDMLRKAGAINIFNDIANSTFTIEEDEIIERDPDLIFICWIGMGQDPTGFDPQSIYNRKKWASVSAIRNKNVHFLPDPMFLFPGPNLLSGLELMIECVSLSV